MVEKKFIVWALGLTLAVGVLAYGAVLAWIYVQQERLLFFPTPLPATHRFDLPGVTEVQVPVSGGHFLSALHYRQAQPKGLIFFLHGNAGDLKLWLTSTDFYRDAGFDLFMIDYRGYGKSSGRIESEAQLHADVRAAWSAVGAHYAGKKVVLYGRSLGSGLAADLATQVSADLLILVSPYTSLTAMARSHYPWVPSSLMRYPLNTEASLRRTRLPVLILHGEEDELIPVSHAVTLQTVRPGIELIKVPGAGHGDIHQFERYEQALKARLAGL
ncbi:MAG: alpha/beta fold hydrolase [Pseudomonadota bacterium]